MTTTTTTEQHDEMKPWQHGIALARLRAIAERYGPHNSFALSPFAQFKKNNIAEAIHKHELIELDGASYWHKRANRVTPITMFQDVAIAHKHIGDLTIKHAIWTVDAGRFNLREAIKQHARSHDIWLHVFEEDTASTLFAFELGFQKVGVKFTSFAEIIGIYFKPCTVGLFSGDALRLRKFPVQPSELLTIERLRLPISDALMTSEMRAIANGVGTLNFANHYSNYNKSKSWSALALRGFSSDPTCILKPAEMPEKWQVENSRKSWQLQWTQLVDDFAGVKPLCAQLCDDVDTQIQRVRFMKLAPAGGELQRHTDQVDKETGTRADQFLRIHIPVATNDRVIFTTWNCDGCASETNMKMGEAWYLDTRKPHQAINGGDSDRIHLVVDVQSNDKLLALLP
jgi:hypothetical protein